MSTLPSLLTEREHTLAQVRTAFATMRGNVRSKESAIALIDQIAPFITKDVSDEPLVTLREVTEPLKALQHAPDPYGHSHKNLATWIQEYEEWYYKVRVPALQEFEGKP